MPITEKNGAIGITNPAGNPGAVDNADINLINPRRGKFTSLTADNLDATAIGATTPGTVAATTLTASGAVSFQSTLGVVGAVTVSPGAAGTFLDFALETEWVGGTLINGDFGGATTLTSDAIGIALNFNTNVTMTTDKDVKAIQIKLPALTQAVANTTVITGLDIPTAGATVQSANAGTITWKGINIQLPNTTQTAGTVTASGIAIAGGTITSGTAYGISMSGAYTTGISMAGAMTTGLSITGPCSTSAITIAQSTAEATAVNIKSFDLGLTLTGGSAVNTCEALRSVLTSNVQVGNWANAILGKIDFSTAGYVTGLSAPICAEIDLGAGVVSAGAYYCYEAELVVGSVGGLGGNNRTGFVIMNASGSGVATWRTGGYIFDLTGLGSATAGNVFDTCTAAAASHALRILIDGVNYYIMLNSNVDA